MTLIMEQLVTLIEELDAADISKLIFYAPRKSSPYKKTSARPVIIKNTMMIQFENFTEKQAFQKNIPLDGFSNLVREYLSTLFEKLSIKTRLADYEVFVKDAQNGNAQTVKIIKRGKSATKPSDTDRGETPKHDKTKKYLLKENTVIAPLVDLGIFTAEGKIVKSNYDKYKQINRFLEIIDDSVQDIRQEKITVVDFGSGKSYLTFITYYFLREIRGLDVTMLGIDLKQDVVDTCNRVAKKYNYHNLSFTAGNIAEFNPNDHFGNDGVDVVICLHACDIATDYALYNAVKWNAKTILAVPCCQHEVNARIKTESLLTKYGIVKERFSALVTDALRANLLEYHGYRVRILEFVDFSHSPKNLLIRARKQAASEAARQKAAKEIDAVLDEYNLYPELCRLFKWRK